MIKFKKLSWSNCFSYGPDNTIDLCGAPLTQLIGKNGYGKSSIALILEEVLFNTNSKKIKKGDILNRYSKDKNYTIEVEFDKDGTLYTVSTTRSNTSSVIKLYRNTVDISNHTATGTYKTIENILGYDSRTFGQIVYQSSVSSLEFLTSTDTARKKFLIDLLNLSVYTRASDVFKEAANGCSKLVDVTQGKISTVSAWLEKYRNEDLSIQVLEEEPLEPKELEENRTLLKLDLTNIETNNKKITQNNTYIKLLEAIQLPEIVPGTVNIQRIATLNTMLAERQKSLREGITLSGKCKGATIKCPTCNQDMDNSTMFNLVEEFKKSKITLEQEIINIKIELSQLETIAIARKTYEDLVIEWEKYHSLIDKKLAKVTQDKNQLANDIVQLDKDILTINEAINKIRTANNLKTAHNSKVKVISEQMVDMHKDLTGLQAELLKQTKQLSLLQILVKAFSTTGLVAYKIECMVKDLEAITNEYLSVLADGRFQLSFQIASSDKLNVVICDNGRDVSIESLSTGERARVNVSTLLAIRKLMQTLSNSRTNLLILDETISNLDADGKEKLIEVLLSEESLNTFLVVHDWEHPLLEKISVIKENNISHLE